MKRRVKQTCSCRSVLAAGRVGLISACIGTAIQLQRRAFCLENFLWSNMRMLLVTKMHYFSISSWFTCVMCKFSWHDVKIVRQDPQNHVYYFNKIRETTRISNALLGADFPKLEEKKQVHKNLDVLWESKRVAKTQKQLIKHPRSCDLDDIPYFFVAPPLLVGLSSYFFVAPPLFRDGQVRIFSRETTADEMVF